MKVMVIVKATADSEEGVMPTQELMEAMGNFNEELVKAGIMESGDGLKPSREGFRVRFQGKERTVTRGPFAETNELIAGYWIWNVASLDEAIEWVKKCPNPMYEDSDIEIRPFYELEDFASVDTSGEFRERETALRNTIEMQKATINTYLFFSGRCDEALDYYQQHVGASVKRVLRFNENPDPMPEGMLPAGYEDKIMHCEFTIGDTNIFATDFSAKDNKVFSSFSLTLTVTTEEQARRVFAALADGGNIDMPLGKTGWSPLYGQVSDKFGIDWMVMLPEA